MTIDKIIEKFDEQYTSMAYGEKWRPGMEFTPSMIKSFLRSSYSELLGEVVEEMEKKRFCNLPEGKNTPAYVAYDIGLDTAISIIKSKLPKEDKNI